MSQTACFRDEVHPIILHAEDRDEDARLFRIVLDEAGIKASIHRAANGEETMLFLHKWGRFKHAPTPDVIFLDLNMPKMTGWEVLAAMARGERFRQIPVVILSTAWHEQERAFAMGACDYIAKPGDFFEFVSEVQRVYAGVLTAGCVALGSS